MKPRAVAFLVPLLGSTMGWLLACATGSTPSATPRSPVPGSSQAAASQPGSPIASPPAASGTTAQPPPAAAAQEPAHDPHSFARPEEVTVDALRLELSVDFNARRLAGRASLHLVHHTPAERLELDTRDLDIQRVLLDGGGEARFTLAGPVPFLGRRLEVQITPGTQWVSIDYATRPEAAALQWLTPAQAGSSSPFLFTQSETILARTWVPCQDSPGVRMTYDATIHVPPGLTAVMSAENPTRPAADGVYSFHMPQRIPAYLLALAVGDLAFRPLSERSGVYALPSVVERAAWELADTPRMIATAESLYGAYRWGRYDLIVLPASYPYGGMENPRLTFATPTILAGDRSLVSLVAHELAHSWSGNLVTNATWNDFWLNEGFTVYIERRIMEALYGRDVAEMAAVLGRQELETTFTELGRGSPDTRLHLDLEGRDPEDATSNVAYEKGAAFLSAVEAAAGRERFDAFLRTYFETFAFQSMDTHRFLAYLRSHLLAGATGAEDRLHIDEWVYGTGLPASAPAVHAAAFDRVDQAAGAFAQGTPPARLDTAGWTTQHWLHFLRGLPAPLGAERMANLDAAFHFTGSGNSEILDLWLLLAIQNRYSPASAALEHFLLTVGRRKLIRPLYAELAKTPDGTETALRIYTRARPTYHPVSQAAIDKVLDWRG